MNQREWLYYLLNSDGKSYYIENGMLKVSATPRPIRYGPDGWKDISIGYDRNIEEWGNVSNFSIPMKFVLDGAEVLRYLLRTFNMETVVRLLIQRQSLYIDNTNYYWYYDMFYRGDIDLSTYEDTELEFTASISQGGISKSIKSFKSTNYQIPVDDVLVKMDGATLISNKKFIVLPVSYAHANNGNFTAKEMIPMQEAIQEGSFFNMYLSGSVASPADAAYSYVDDEVLVQSTKYNGLTTANVLIQNINITGTIQLFSFLGARVGLDFILERVKGPVTSPTYTSVTLFSLNYDFISNEVYSFSLTSGPITIEAGETFFIYTRPNAFQNTNAWRFGENTTWSYTIYDKLPTTYVKAKRCRKVYSELVEAVTGVSDPTISALLDGKNNIVLTSGDGIRGLEDATIKTNLGSFTNTMNVLFNTGFGVIKNKLYLESKSFFLKDENVIPLGQIKGFKNSKAKDVLGNVVKIGYQPKESDDVNGRYSFNNTNVYTSPIESVTKDIVLVSDYITDPYVIEIYRANLDGKKTTDNDKDSGTIMLNIDIDNPQTLAEETAGLPAGTVYYNLKRVAYDSVDGLPVGADMYNIEEFTPARLLKQHESYLNAVYDGFTGSYLEFQTASKNELLKTTQGSLVVTENADYLIRDTPKLFKPEIFEIVPEPNADIIPILEENPNRCFSFIHPNGYTYRGFNMIVGVAPNSQQDQAFKLLAVANQDLSTLKLR